MANFRRKRPKEKTYITCTYCGGKFRMKYLKAPQMYTNYKNDSEKYPQIDYTGQ